MEKNTFATSTYISVSADSAFQYLADLKHLEEWTLGNKMQEKVDECTWVGSSSASKKSLYYQIHEISELPFPSFEWRIGSEYGHYRSYPVFLFPSAYVDRGASENGTYFHWLSFISPQQRTPLITDGYIEIVHSSECRALKAVLERSVNLSAPASAQYQIKTSSIYIDAPFELLIGYLGELTNMNDWCHLHELKECINLNYCKFLNEYGQLLETRTKTYRFYESALIEYDSTYVESGLQIRSPALIVPCAHAFGEVEASGCVLHRIVFVSDNNKDAVLYPLDDIAAENLNIKRLVEMLAGNPDSLAQGLSYTGLKNSG